MLITDYLLQECVSISLQGESREEIINELLDLIVAKYPETDRPKVLDSLFERESVGPTAIGKGVAIPHARVEEIPNVRAAFGLLKKDVDFNPIDGKSVQLVFLILFPRKKVDLQLRFLARVARLLQQEGLHDNLVGCESPKEVIDTFKAYEKDHFH